MEFFHARKKKKSLIIHFHYARNSIRTRCSVASFILGSFARQFLSGFVKKCAADSLRSGLYENVNECGFYGLTGKQDLCCVAKTAQAVESLACLATRVYCVHAKLSRQRPRWNTPACYTRRWVWTYAIKLGLRSSQLDLFLNYFSVIHANVFFLTLCKRLLFFPLTRTLANEWRETTGPLFWE